MERKQATEFDPELLRLFDGYVHGLVSRRDFFDRAKVFAGAAGVTALVESLAPNYAWAQQVPADDKRITVERVSFESPQGQGTIKGILVRPAGAKGKLPAVMVVHENRGLNPYVEDVARRVGVAGYMALAPDALSPSGGYPGDDDKGREMQSKLDGKKMMEDWTAGVRWLQKRADCTGKVGVVGFCYGGGVANQMAVRIPDLAAAVPFYGGQPSAEDAAKIKAPLLIHYAGLDERVNAGWPAYKAALEANHVTFSVHIYDNVNHGFHNDTTPRYDKAAAELAWSRTLEFFGTHLK